MAVLERLTPRALGVIQQRGPILADALAKVLDVRCADAGDPREARKRVIRDVVRYLRHQGLRICANRHEGYWEARDQRDWDNYKASKRGEGVCRFVEVRDYVEAVTDRTSGQMRLPLTPVLPGHAMMEG